MLEQSQGNWTPQMIAAMPLIQIAGLTADPELTPQTVIERLNAQRAERGEPPIIPRKRG
jgi:hypothetical protein